MQELSPVCLHVNWEIWPLNVEPSKNPNKLTSVSRYSGEGRMLGYYGSIRIYSEPITLDLKKATRTP